MDKIDERLSPRERDPKLHAMTSSSFTGPLRLGHNTANGYKPASHAQAYASDEDCHEPGCYARWLLPTGYCNWHNKE